MGEVMMVGTERRMRLWGNFDVQERLRRWAYWGAGRDDCGLGYPASVIARLAMPSSGYERVSDVRPIVSDDEAGEVERAILTLSEHLRILVVCHYMLRLSVRRKCQRLGVSSSKYYRDLESALESIKNILDKWEYGTNISLNSDSVAVFRSAHQQLPSTAT